MSQIAVPAADRRITKAEACRQLGVDRKAVERMIAAGDLQTVSIPGNVRAIIRQSSVDELLRRMAGDSRQAS